MVWLMMVWLMMVWLMVTSSDGNGMGWYDWWWRVVMGMTHFHQSQRWLKNDWISVATSLWGSFTKLDHPPFLEGLPGKEMQFSLTMVDYQRVRTIVMTKWWVVTQATMVITMVLSINWLTTYWYVITNGWQLANTGGGVQQQLRMVKVNNQWQYSIMNKWMMAVLKLHRGWKPPQIGEW